MQRYVQTLLDIKPRGAITETEYLTPAGEKFCKKVGSDNEMLSSLALPIFIADVVPNGFMYH